MASPCALLLFALVAIASGKLIQHTKSGPDYHGQVVQHAKVTPPGYRPRPGPKYGKYIYVDWCKNGKFYAEDPKDCSRYLQKVGYYAYTMPCAPGTHWDQKKCACVTGDCKKPNKYIYIPYKRPVYQKHGGFGGQKAGPPHHPPPHHQEHEPVHPPPPPPHHGGHEPEHPHHGGEHHVDFGQQHSG